MSASGRYDELEILDNSNPSDATSFINDGCTIVDDATGHIYRVLERYSSLPDVVLLDRDWDASTPAPDYVWVVPPPVTIGFNVLVSSGRYPCVGVFQKIIRF
jgi:hypothetical protein